MTERMDPLDEAGDLPVPLFPNPRPPALSIRSLQPTGPTPASSPTGARLSTTTSSPGNPCQPKKKTRLTLRAPDYRALPGPLPPEYAEKITELQRRLRPETVVLPKPDHRIGVTIRELVETLLLAALIFFAVRASFQNFRVQGGSMQPSLNDGEYLIVNKLNYAELEPLVPQLGALLRLRRQPRPRAVGQPHPRRRHRLRGTHDPDRDFIKRVIGTPGDTVQIDPGTGEVRVNGKLLSEPYIQGTTACGSACVYKVPAADSPEAHDTCGSDDCYFVMGDNRQNSSDSRQGWMVPRENIIGKTLVTYWNDGSPNIGLAPNHTVSEAAPQPG